MVYVITGYLHSGKQRLWLGRGTSGPACWRQAGLGVPFLLGWPTGKRVLQSEETTGRVPRTIAHHTRYSKYWLTPNSSLGTRYVQGDYHCPFVHSTVLFVQHTRAEYYQRKDQ